MEPPRSFLSGFHQFEADEAPALRRLQVLAQAQLPADIGLVLARHLAEAEIVQRVAVIELEAGHMALLDAQRCQRLQAVGLDAERCGHFQEMLPQARCA